MGLYNVVHLFFTEPSELDPTLEALNDENLDGLDGTDGALSALDGTLTEQTITPAVAETPVEEEKGKSNFFFFYEQYFKYISKGIDTM